MEGGFEDDVGSCGGGCMREGGACFDTYNSGRAGSMSFDATRPALFVLGPGALPQKLALLFDLYAAPAAAADGACSEPRLDRATLCQMLDTIYAAAKTFVLFLFSFCFMRISQLTRAHTPLASVDHGVVPLTATERAALLDRAAPSSERATRAQWVAAVLATPRLCALLDRNHRP